MYRKIIDTCSPQITLLPCTAGTSGTDFLQPCLSWNSFGPLGWKVEGIRKRWPNLTIHILRDSTVRKLSYGISPPKLNSITWSSHGSVYCIPWNLALVGKRHLGFWMTVYYISEEKNMSTTVKKLIRRLSTLLSNWQNLEGWWVISRKRPMLKCFQNISWMQAELMKVRNKETGAW